MICTVCQITIYVGLSETAMKLTYLKVLIFPARFSISGASYKCTKLIME